MDWDAWRVDGLSESQIHHVYQEGRTRGYVRQFRYRGPFGSDLDCGWNLLEPLAEWEVHQFQYQGRPSHRGYACGLFGARRNPLCGRLSGRGASRWEQIRFGDRPR